MKALKDYMTIAGLTQAELAKRLNIDVGQLNHWLTKRRTPSVKNLKDISVKTGISMDKLAKDL